MLQLYQVLFADSTMTNIQKICLTEIVSYVPASNLGKNSGMLCIRLGNLQFTNFHKICNNPTNFFAFISYSATISARGGV